MSLSEQFICLPHLPGMGEGMQCRQVQIDKKGKNKSREEIFYQMKGFYEDQL